MRGIKRVLLVLVVLLVALAVVAFVLENQQGVALSFLGWTTGQLPLAVFITLAFIVGMLIGPLLGGLLSRKARRKQAA